MTKILSLVFAVGFVLQMMLFSTAYGLTGIIESSRIYPSHITANDKFKVCAQIDKNNPCIKDTIYVSYDYGIQTGYMYELMDPASELYDLNVWCGTATAKSGVEVISVQFQCKDNLDIEQTDVAVNYLNVGLIFIHTTSKFDDDLIYGKYVNEPLEIVVYVDNPGNVTMTYTIYNSTLGTPIIKDKALQLVEGQFKGIFVIPKNAPTGFIELYVKSKVSSDTGGKFLSYAAIPYNATISLNGETIMGNMVNASLSINLE